MKWKLCLIITIVSITLLISILYLNKQCKGIYCLSFEGNNKYKIQEIYRSDNDIFSALYKDNNNIIRIEVHSNIEKLHADQNIRSRIIKMKALFANTQSPYPGDISDEIRCSEQFKPILKEDNINGLDISYFSGYLNDRLVFGSCTEDQLRYRGILALFYCSKQKQLFQLEIIAPKDLFTANKGDYINMLKSISCKTS